MVIERWTIFWATSNPGSTPEQAGRRPVLVISADEVNVLHQVTVLPLTSVKNSGRRIYRNEVLLEPGKTGLDQAMIALAHQIRTLDKARLEEVAGKITDEALQTALAEAVKVQLGLG